MNGPSSWQLARRSIFFWLGLFFSALGLLFTGIAFRAAQREMAYQQEGQVVEGTVLTKTVRHAVRGENTRTRYLVNYQFRTDDGVRREGLQEVSVEEWEGTQEGEPFRVRYLPNDSATSRAAGETDWAGPIVAGVMGLIVGTIGGTMLTLRLRRIRLTVRLMREGIPTEGTIVRVSPANVTINGVQQWRICYRFTDQAGQRRDGLSDLLSPMEARHWKKGDKGAVRFDRRDSAQNIWAGKDSR
jgi:hypothetical protein